MPNIEVAIVDIDRVTVGPTALGVQYLLVYRMPSLSKT